jgi:hypothetical protein
MNSIAGILLWLWWMSWFGILGSFFYIGVDESRYEYLHQYPSTCFSIALLAIVSILWIVFFIVQDKTWKREPEVLTLHTWLGTYLAIFTLLGVAYFATVAPRVR